MNILVTGVGSTLGYGILETIKQSGLNCQVSGTDYLHTAVGLYKVDYPYILPDIYQDPQKENAWLNALQKIISERKIKYVLVGLDFEVPLFAKHKGFIENNTDCKVIVSSTEVVGICNDKWLTYRFLRDSGFDAPRSCLPDGLDEFVKNTPFPWIVKPRVGSTSKGLFRINNIETLSHALENCDDPIIQEEVGDVEGEFTCGVVVASGRVLSSLPLRRKLKNGNTSVAYFNKSHEVDRFIRQVAEKLKPDGPINIQLRLTANGPMVFEINPRFSGTTPVRSIFGVNEVRILIEYLETGMLSDKPFPKEGMVIRYMVDQFVSDNDLKKLNIL
ncbi:ATP-grasp domain-containing protein [bacterium]|nr:ATP-grasp domain-containing protein [bacterium]